MIEIIWEFAVREEGREEFEREYSASGAWAEFFRRSPAYQGTRLLASESNRYLTCDRWESQEAYEEFRLANRQEYSDIDDRFKALTVSERCLGIFEMK
jgi:heme-degrading monooxygenase HmoA